MKKCRTSRSILLIGTIAALCSSRSALSELPVWYEEFKLTRGCSDGSGFGWSVAVSGDVAIVGMQCKCGNIGGSAHVYRWDGSGWMPDGTDDVMTSNYPRIFDLYGYSVDIQEDLVNGDVAVVGAFRDLNGTYLSGEVYVYRWDVINDKWGNGHELVKPSFTYDACVGWSVATSKDVIVAGAPEYIESLDPLDRPGRVYIYRWNDSSSRWEISLIPNIGDHSDMVGYSVAADGDTVMVGAPGDDNGAGAVYVYVWNGQSWDLEAKLTVGGDTGRFGSSISLSGDAALIGAPDDGYQTASAAGSAYVFRWNGTTWTQEAKLNGMVSQDFHFGYSVAIETDPTNSDIAVIGIPDSSISSSNLFAYVFRRINSNWYEVGHIEASDTSFINNNNCFGDAIAIEDDVVFVGAPGTRNEGDEYSGGAVYVYDSDLFTPPSVVAAVSRKTHGTAGDFDIDVFDESDDQDIECRQYGVTKLVVTFGINIQGVDGLDTSDVEISSGTVDAVSLTASNELTIEMSDTLFYADKISQPLTVSFPGIADANDESIICQDSIDILQLVSDVRPDGSVNSIDRVDVRDALGDPVTGSNFRCDVRADGSIDAIDRVDVRDAVGKGLPGVTYVANGCKELFDEAGVADYWTPYWFKHAPVSWDADETIKYDDWDYSQRIHVYDVAAPRTKYCGLRQTISAGVGDAITFETHGRTYHNNNNYAGLFIGVQWDGSTTVPEFEGDGQGGTEYFTLSTAGNATSNEVTVFLHAKRNGNAGANNLVWFDETVTYHASVPPAPVVYNAYDGSIYVNVAKGSNSSDAEFAITIDGGAYTEDIHWVQADGTVGTSEAWLTDAEWATTEVFELWMGTLYGFKVKARYSSSYPQETYLGEISAAYTNDLINGRMEAFSSGMADGWTTYWYKHEPVSWDADGVVKHSGDYSQRIQIFDAYPPCTKYCGLKQTIDANVGDAITFDVYGRTYHNNNNYAGLFIGANWDGDTKCPETDFMDEGQSGSTFFKLKTAGNATSTTVTVFLHAKRNHNAGPDNLVWFDDANCYHVYVPDAPTVDNPTARTLDVDVNPGDNWGNSNIQYAITIDGGAYREGTDWVQSDGSVSTSEVWQNDLVWDTTEVTGLTTSTTYTFKVKARYNSIYTEDTALGSGAQGTPSGG